MVTYGKTLGGGLPVGVVCGRRDLMKRFRDERPADICFARGTFNSHPYVMGAMQVFLERLQRAPVQALYDGLDARWNGRAARSTRRWPRPACRCGGQPVHDLDRDLHRAGALQLDAAVLPAPQGLALSWVGTGRLIFSLNYTTPTSTRCCSASWPRRGQMQAMAGGGRTRGRNKTIRRGICARCCACCVEMRRPPLRGAKRFSVERWRGGAWCIGSSSSPRSRCQRRRQYSRCRGRGR
jgi:glutamate-1-semialdehyde 2,1-aminomutase